MLNRVSNLYLNWRISLIEWKQHYLIKILLVLEKNWIVLNLALQILLGTITFLSKFGNFCIHYSNIMSLKECSELNRAYFLSNNCLVFESNRFHIEPCRIRENIFSKIFFFVWVWQFLCQTVCFCRCWFGGSNII